MNKTLLTLKVQLSSSLSRSEDAELLNLFVITPARLPGYTKTSESYMFSDSSALDQLTTPRHCTVTDTLKRGNNIPL